MATLAIFQGMGWRGAFPLFFVLMALAFFSVTGLKVEETKAEKPPSFGSSLALLKEPVFLYAVLGIFLYVGAESCMGRFLNPTLQALGMNAQAANKWGPTLFFLLLTIGRLLGGLALTAMSPSELFHTLGDSGSSGRLRTLVRILQPRNSRCHSAGLGFANIWPMLFSITVERKPECANELSGLMCMAISGGALVPLLDGMANGSGMGSKGHL